MHFINKKRQRDGNRQPTAHDDFYNYIDLEYYPYELTGKDKALLPISRFLKGDIDIGLCCNAFHNLSLADYMEKSMPRGYTDEIMKELGIKNEQYIQKIH